jgi:Flp pilus assembly protein TadG
VSGKRLARRFISDPSGAAALEFAILAPLFIALTFGVIILGWAFYTMSNMNFVAERVGRVLFLNPGMSSSEIEERVAAELAHLDQSALTVTVSFETASAGYRIGRATVSYEFAIEIPLAGTYPWLYTTTVSVPLG